MYFVFFSRRYSFEGLCEQIKPNSFTVPVVKYLFVQHSKKEMLFVVSAIDCNSGSDLPTFVLTDLFDFKATEKDRRSHKKQSKTTNRRIASTFAFGLANNCIKHQTLVPPIRSFANGPSGECTHIQSVLIYSQAVSNFCQQRACRHASILKHFGERLNLPRDRIAWCTTSYPASISTHLVHLYFY